MHSCRYCKHCKKAAVPCKVCKKADSIAKHGRCVSCESAYQDKKTEELFARCKEGRPRTTKELLGLLKEIGYSNVVFREGNRGTTHDAPLGKKVDWKNGGAMTPVIMVENTSNRVPKSRISFEQYWWLQDGNWWETDRRGIRKKTIGTFGSSFHFWPEDLPEIYEELTSLQPKLGLTEKLSEHERMIEIQVNQLRDVLKQQYAKKEAAIRNEIREVHQNRFEKIRNIGQEAGIGFEWRVYDYKP